ncbi:hypothetical protein AQUCO_02700337v1 [Aquilegia coerulea]|uniref:Phorbol-ester/DAG-type domain-containing protein n=1 Tax=Aquilegia coerulea TaxID=218851 RepID=A0A2G5D7B1_AQUCA|nr:hypothetical protein AQUCO_02700337v1 [Aquilegia coerulea]
MIYTDIKHFSHGHNLKLLCDKTPYKCDGCKEPGWGPRYRCEDCNFDLHKECALYSSSMSHPFYKNRSFEFLESPITYNRYCNACGRDILGFVYHCYATGHDLHPLCANLPCTLQADGVELRLHDKLSSKCGKCRTRTLWGNVRGWSYRSSTGYEFYVSCVKKMAVENWEKKYFGEGEKNDLAMEITNPTNFQLTNIRGSNSGKGMISKCWKIAKVVISLLFSILTGDPIGVTTCLIGSLFS